MIMTDSLPGFSGRFAHIQFCNILIKNDKTNGRVKYALV